MAKLPIKPIIPEVPKEPEEIISDRKIRHSISKQINTAYYRDEYKQKLKDDEIAYLKKE